MRALVLAAWATTRVQLRTAELAQSWDCYDLWSERRDAVWAWWLGRTGEDLHAG